MTRVIQIAIITSLFSLCTRTDAQVNLSNGLVAYYPFNGTFNDASGTGNNGVPINGTSFGTDQWGNVNSAAFFDGTDDFISVPGSVSLTPGHNFSMAFRFKTTSSNLQILLSKSDYATANSFQYQIGINGGSFFTNNGLFYATNHVNGCISTSGLASNYAFGTTPISNQWYCVVLTFNNGVKKVFMNGVLINTVTVSGTSNNTSVDSCVSGTFRMGTWWQNDPRYFSGLMDEVRLYNRTLNQAEVDSLCNIVTPPAAETIINQYAAVTSRVTCSNTFTVDTATGFAVGDTILVVQMKGAVTDTTNTSSFGSITSYNGAGNYEYNVIQSIVGNSVTLMYGLQKSYDIPAGLVQFVKVPSFTNYNISQKNSCLPWNGLKGGVYALRVAGTLSLNSSIDVSGRGFKGGLSNPVYRSTYICSVTRYFDPPNMDSSAQKGEAIAISALSKSYGRGNQANGGGGGNAANSGGAGGGNGGAGGAGGMQYQGCTGSSATGGIGGAAIIYSATTNRAFMGGGGGAGQVNEQLVSNGGNGGAIILINAGNISGNGYSIIANGADAPECSAPTTGCNNDGTGGGGGGGTLLIATGSISGTNLLAKGGKGANLYLTTAFLNLYHGPGGGGGGGAILVSSAISSALPTANVVGGNSGVMPQNSNAAHGSLPGSIGQTYSGFGILLPTTIYVPNIVSSNFADSFIQCNSRKFINTTTTTTTNIKTWNWSFGDGGTSTTQNPVYSYLAQGTYSVKLIATDSLGCKDSVTKFITISCPDSVINRYAAVLSRGTCNNIYTVDTTTGFLAGDTILVIQMKGGVIDTSNSSSFGSVLAYNNAGYYEYNVIQAVAGNNITLKYNTLHNYTIPAGKVQFVKTPSFANYTSTSLRKLSCLSWTGTKGGVFAIRVAGTLTLNADVDVSGKGFSGGLPLYKNVTNCNKTDYFYPAANNEGGRKGEGIAELTAAKLYGRGAQANGGGGGNDNNSGGGGGANYSGGGLGGNQAIIGSCATTANIGGFGGTALSGPPAARAFMGGGGGCGHGNDTAEKAGGNGGGIIFISANTLTGANHMLRANGADAPECSGSGIIGGGCANDGGGGGGGGGLIFSTSSSITNLMVQATGGKGSNVYVIGGPSVGPGGGGSGGAWAFLPGSLASSVSFSGTGGAAGVLPQFGSTSYGAQAGSNGQSFTSSAVPFASVPFNGNVLNLAFSDSATSCFGRKLINTSMSISTAPLTYSWFFPGGGTSGLANPTYTFPGYGGHLVTLTIIDSNGCSSSLAQYVNIAYRHFALGIGDTAMCSIRSVSLNATGGVSYMWTPASGLSSPNTAATQALPTVSTNYTVRVTDSIGCVDSDVVAITIVPAKQIVARPADTTICNGDKLRMFATGAVVYQWTPASGLDNPTVASPIATISGDIHYIVTGTDSLGCVSSDTVNIRRGELPSVDATAEGIGSKCEAKSVLLKATGSASDYSWTPNLYLKGGNSNNSSIYATPPTTMVYTLIGRNASLGCQNTDTVTAFVYDEAMALMPDAFSPNGDSRNDMIHPLIFCDFTLEEYRIFDRWGKEVFVSNSATDGWNGNRGGTQADVGIYHYYMVGRRTSNNQKIEMKGNFMLMR